MKRAWCWFMVALTASGCLWLAALDYARLGLI